jgi:hypothetical protein
MEKRSSRKRSRKASEREEASEEPPAPLAKSRRRSSGGKSGEAEEKTRKGNARSKRKGLRVSFDILENRLSVGEGETAGSSEAGCTLTLASSSGDGPPSVTPEPAPQTGTAGTKDAGSRKPQTVEIKFKRPDFTGRRDLGGATNKCWQLRDVSSGDLLTPRSAVWMHRLL